MFILKTLFSFSQTSICDEEITSFYIDYEYMYEETYVGTWSSWTDVFYDYTETNFTKLNIGLRYYFK